MAATTNPLHSAHPASIPPVSKQRFAIAGILTTVYGLSELPSSVESVACLWLLHPRLQTQEIMAPIAARIIRAWNARVVEGHAGRPSKGLIAVSFDQRNHGSREVEARANMAWRENNPRHAQDMFSCYRKPCSFRNSSLQSRVSLVSGAGHMPERWCGKTWNFSLFSENPFSE